MLRSGKLRLRQRGRLLRGKGRLGPFERSVERIFDHPSGRETGETDLAGMSHIMGVLGDYMRQTFLDELAGRPLFL